MTTTLLLVLLLLSALVAASRGHSLGRALDARANAIVASRRSSQAAPLPPEWNWARVREEEARAWSRGHAGAHLAPGSYASRVVNQHRAGWCGCCYLIAVVQMIQDRWNLLIGQHALLKVMYPYAELDAQCMLDEYDKFRGGMFSGWTACHGGDPRQVIACFNNGSCRLFVAPGDGGPWSGHARSKERQTCEERARPNIRVGEVRTIPNTRDAVKRAIYDRGSVALGIDAQCLIAARDGVADTTSRVKRNHAVTVVGWQRHGDEGECWLIRNSWGAETVPNNLPADIKCVKRDANSCSESTRPWRGMASLPGYVLVPMWYIERDAGAGDSPWYECSVEPKGREMA